MKKTIILIVIKNLLTAYMMSIGYFYFIEYQHITFWFILALLTLTTIQIDIDQAHQALAKEFVDKLIRGYTNGK